MNAYLTKSWETVHGMIDAFFVLLPKLILAIVVFVLFWFGGTIVNRLVGYFSHRYRRGPQSQSGPGTHCARDSKQEPPLFGHSMTGE